MICSPAQNPFLTGHQSPQTNGRAVYVPPSGRKGRQTPRRAGAVFSQERRQTKTDDRNNVGHVFVAYQKQSSLESCRKTYSDTTEGWALIERRLNRLLAADGDFRATSARVTLTARLH